MIRPVIIFLSAATLIYLTACETDQPVNRHTKHKFGYDSDQQTVVGTGNNDNGNTPSVPDNQAPDNNGPIAPPPPPPPSNNQTPKPDSGNAQNGANNQAPAPKKDYPYAQPVPGKPGFVTSPYAPYSGYVDVRGFPPGTEVKDPYTQKVFLVP